MSALTEGERRAIEEACKDLMIRYAATIDARDFDGYCALFTEEMELAMPGQPVTTSRSALRRGLERRPADLTSRHVITNMLVEALGPDEARGRCYLSLYRIHGAAGPDGTFPLRQPAAIGEYHDRYVRTHEGWRIRARRLEMIFRTETNQSA